MKASGFLLVVSIFFSVKYYSEQKTSYNEKKPGNIHHMLSKFCSRNFSANVSLLAFRLYIFNGFANVLEKSAAQN